ncbi:MAG: SDR family NAD(P)-dependent oxidoreductase [Aerococcus sp.]|nr:SDR family NAD(P)-dependent oxidoreductase [Aerococcus sp.]
MSFDFTNKTVIVTGGTGGIGYEVAKGVVMGGGRVVIMNRNVEKASAVAHELGENNAYYHLDLSDSEQTRQAMQQVIAEQGPIDALVNSAGMISMVPFEELDDAEWAKIIQINLTGTYLVNQEIFNHFKTQGGGRIVNVSSVAGKLGGGLLGTAAYAAAKGGVNALTKAVAKAGGPFNIACNAVCPSYTDTPMTASIHDNPENEERIKNLSVFHRGARPEEPAQMILFFASDQASFITGEIGDVAGGIVMDG